MSAVFQNVTIGWGGQEYTIKPTMRLINDIEQSISLAVTAQRMASGQPPLSHIAIIAGKMLRAAGAKVTDEEVYAEIATGDPEAITGMVNAIFAAAFPMPGKPEAPTNTTS